MAPKSFTRVLLKFKDISPRAFEHPTDRAALAGLRKIKGFDLVLKKIVGAFGERRMNLMFLSSAVRVGPNQRPDLHNLLKDVCKVLDLETIPELYITQSPQVNAAAYGIDQPFIVLNTGLVNMMTKEELRTVIGHEVGHILSGHVLYKTMNVILINLGFRLFAFLPLGIAVLPIMLALKEWDRKSELSADRAGLLVSQDPETSLKTIMKIAGGSGKEEYNLDEFEKQAEEYHREGNIVDHFYKIMNLLWMTHPFPVLRIVELRKWADSEEYQKILNLDYPRRTDEDAKASNEWKEAMSSYKKEFSEAKDNLSSLFKDVAEAGEGTISEIFSMFKKK